MIASFIRTPALVTGWLIVTVLFVLELETTVVPGAITPAVVLSVTTMPGRTAGTVSG
jgi:hypothetical protein